MRAVAVVAVGFGLELVWLAAPMVFPNAPEWIWQITFWLGCILIVGPGVFWFCDRPRDDVTIPAYEAIKFFAKVRPNSDDTTAINLADGARLGEITSWGRPVLNMHIPTHITAVEQIPPDVWSYAVIDSSVVNGPLPQSKMRYRQEYIKPHTKDDRTIYEAVCFNKKELKSYIARKTPKS